MRVFLSLGSNLGDREANLRAAIAALRRSVEIDAISSLYETDPVGVADQPTFLNLVVEGHASLDPRALLEAVKGTERELGRQTTYRWGPRVIDIDIILYGDQVVCDPDLTIPHVEMDRRGFVLVPLAEIAPDVVDPRSGLTAAEMARQVGASGVRLVGPLAAAPEGDAGNRTGGNG